MVDFLAEAQELFDYTQTLRRDFHAHPELGFQEVRTAGIVAKELNELGLEVATGVAETGVIAMLDGGSPGPTVLLRFDMDALPIEEETGADYASRNPGVMHACGHDGHTAIGLTVARMLHKHRKELTGAVKFVFQPAEEGLGGAERMVKEGVLANPKPDCTLAMHLWNEFPVGKEVVTPGPAMASAATFSIKVTGKGAHGATPHAGVDPVLAAAHIVTVLQSIVARNVNPLEGAVVSVTAVQAGRAFNVIPSEASLRGTLRSFDPGVRELVLRRFEEIVQGTAAALGCTAETRIEEITPAVVNDTEMAKHVQTIVSDMLPEDELDVETRLMVSEDMAFMMQEIPGCYFFVGSSNSDKGFDYGHHHPRFDFDERAMPRGAALMAAAAFDLLKG
jgi:amidohydrolase